MKQQWDVEEIIEHFTLLPPEVNFLGRNEPHNHLGKALLLKFFQYEGRFPEYKAEIPPAISEYVAQQLSLSPEAIHDYKWEGRAIKEHRRQIRVRLGFHPATVDDQKALRNWLIEEVLPHEHRPAYLEQLAYQRLRQLQIEPPTRGRMERLVRSALHQYEQAFFTDTAARLPNIVKVKLRQLIYRREALTTDIDLEKPEDDDPSHYPIHDLKIQGR